MANPEHLAKLKEGVKTWNEWREENPDATPDLSGARLSGEILREAELNGADLSNTHLRRANLNHANLCETDLTRANLSGANLNWVNLIEANLSGANLSGANLSAVDFRRAYLGDTNLTDVNFSGANLMGADLSRAIFSYTNLAFNDLTNVKGLDTLNHTGPSSLDSQTLTVTKNLSAIFLQGCGLSDWEIEAYQLYNPNLTNDEIIDIQQHIFDIRKNGAPIQFHSLFISYSAQDDTISKKLYADLQKAGVRCWFAPKDLPIGRKIRPGLNEAIQKHDRTLLILSKDSIKSPWVEAEVETALQKGELEDREVLFPISIDAETFVTQNPLFKLIQRTTNIGDFSEWTNPAAYQKQFDKLLRDLKQ